MPSAPVRCEAGLRPFFFEKWYIDTLLPGGDVLLVYLGRARVLGVWLTRVTADLFTGDGNVISGLAPGRAPKDGDVGLDFGAARIHGQELAFETAGLSGRLAFSPRAGAIDTPEPFLHRGTSSLSWQIELPDADVSGTLTWPGGGREASGRGYRDRVAFDITPWRLPVSVLEWGRAACAEHAAVWMRAQTPDGLVQHGWLDGSPQDTADLVCLGPQRTLLHGAVADLPGLRAGPLRPLMKQLTRDPVETKWAAEAAILGAKGRAIHERVVWR